MIRGMTLLWGTLALIVGVALFLVKFEVQALEDDLARNNRDIRRNQEEIHILRAEWAYLNDPARLAELNGKFLGLEPIEGTRITTLASLPVRRYEVPMGRLLAESGQAAPWMSYPYPKPVLQAPELAARVSP